MGAEQALDGLAYCGLVCTVCSHGRECCAGCRGGGGPEVCFRRQCCVEHGLEGCWQCGRSVCAEASPDQAWTGLTTGCLQMIQAMGPDVLVALVKSRLGASFDYGYLRYRTPQEIEAILRGEQDIPHEEPEAG